MGNKPSLFKRIIRPLVNNEVETGASKWYPELEPRTFDAAADEVRAAVERVVEKRPRWQMESIGEQANQFDFTAETKRMGYIDDVTVDLEHRDGSTTVSVYSRSREGKGDFGKNAERIEEFYDRLATELRVT
ncbi:MAG: DUF1499 domain-containing protein [Myxococcota bacterium]